MEPTGDEDLVEPPAINRSSLRKRKDPVDAPFGSQSVKDRALKAAKEHLESHTKMGVCASKWEVNRGLVHYYKGILLDEGFTPSSSLLSPSSASLDGDRFSTCSSSKSKASAWEEYCNAYVCAGQLVDIVGKRAAAKTASERFGVAISATTALRAAQTPGVAPKPAGRDLVIPSVVEYKLEDLCLCLREMKLPIFRFMVINYVNTLLKGTVEATMLKHREVRKYWYYNWLGRCKRMKTANIRPLEVTRAAWATADNMIKHYDQLAQVLVETGIAMPNVNFEKDVPLSEPIKIMKPGRIASMDETRLTNDTTEVGKQKKNRILKGKVDDSGDVLVNKGGGDGTGIGGSTADGLDLPGAFCF